MTAPWMTAFIGRLALKDIPVEEEPTPGLAPARRLRINADDWGRLAQEAKNWDCRWVAAWGEDRGEKIIVNVCLEKEGVYLVVRTDVQYAAPILTSHTPCFAAADRPERHIQDMLGIAFTDHPDARRWTRHQAWKDSEYPLRRNFPVAGNPPALAAADDGYRFLHAQGSGVYEVPVGPVHAGTIEPGHFRFQAVGETVLNLEERLGYTHKGIEKIAVGRDAAGLARLAGRVSGDSTVAHAWAACMAMEKAAGITVPERALILRAVMAERERVANHLGDIGGICNDVSFAFGFYQFGRLREAWQRVSHAAFGHRFMMNSVVPGGVAADINDQAVSAMQKQIGSMRRELDGLYDILDDLPSLEDRLDTTGYLSPDAAKAFGVLGYVGRASSHAFDVRRDAPYAPYDQLSVEVPVLDSGDVAARVQVRAREILVSFDLIEKLIADTPTRTVGPVTCEWKNPVAGAEGLGFVEGFRGEILAYVRFEEDGRIARYFPRDPSWLSFPALEKLARGSIIPDFPVCNKSVNGSYSGHDL